MPPGADPGGPTPPADCVGRTPSQRPLGRSVSPHASCDGRGTVVSQISLSTRGRTGAPRGTHSTPNRLAGEFRRGMPNESERNTMYTVCLTLAPTTSASLRPSMTGPRATPYPSGPAILASLLVSLLGWGCCHYGVVNFSADQQYVCPNQTTTLRWEVKGPARLRADRGPGDWDEGFVPSKGERSFSTTRDTTFTVTATKQNPAEGNFKNQPVAVFSTGYRGDSATCSETGVCTATFMPTSAGPHVSKLSMPVAVGRGQSKAVDLCVTHAGLPKTCIAAGASAAVDVPFEGPWTLETTVAPGTPPPQLRIQMDFNCPSR